jgi:hypothetical protein
MVVSNNAIPSSVFFFRASKIMDAKGFWIMMALELSEYGICVGVTNYIGM